MPVTVRKTASGYRVSTPGGVKARGTTKAEAQRRLLNAVDCGFKPTGRRGR